LPWPAPLNATFASPGATINRIVPPELMRPSAALSASPVKLKGITVGLPAPVGVNDADPSLVAKGMNAGSMAAKPFNPVWYVGTPDTGFEATSMRPDELLPARNTSTSPGAANAAESS
jgi:hypothetical protein